MKIKSNSSFITMFLFFNSILIAQNVGLINEEKLKQIIDEREGKFLVINVWATWCIPCREEFPDLVKLYSENKDKIDLLGISVDYEDEIDSKIKPFLNENKVNFPIYVNDFEKDDELIIFLNTKWNGALPGTFIYDKNGKQVKFMEGKHSYESFSSVLNKIISKE